MAFKLGSTSVFADTSAVYTKPTTTARGAGLFSDGTVAYWTYPGETNHVVGAGFRYRSVFTHGYLAGGYKGFNPWRSVNKTWHANDITYYCGEQLDRPSAYAMGTFSDYYGYVHGNSTGAGAFGVHTSSINLHNGTGRTRGRDQFGTSSTTPFGYGGNDLTNSVAGGSTAGQDNPGGTGVNAGVPYGSAAPAGSPDVDNDPRIMDGVGGWEMKESFGNGWGIPNQIGQVGYIGGGSLPAASGFQKFHFGTEVMYTTTASNAVTGAAAAAPGETKGYYSFAGTRKYILYSTDAWTAFTSACGPDGVCKPMPTKWGFHYWGSGNNVTLPQVKLNESTNTDSTMANKVRAYGEENMEMGQDWGYMLGQYDNQQNNHTVKYTYATDGQLTLGYASRPKGHIGQSSGQCFSAAATITSAYRDN